MFFLNVYSVICVFQYLVLSFLLFAFFFVALYPEGKRENILWFQMIL